MTAVTKLRSNLTLVTQDNEDEYDRQPVELGGYSDAFYGRPEEDDRVYFPVDVANNLLYSDLVMEVFMKMGVHNWPDFNEAMAEVERIWKESV